MKPRSASFRLALHAFPNFAQRCKHNGAASKKRIKTILKEPAQKNVDNATSGPLWDSSTQVYRHPVHLFCS